MSLVDEQGKRFSSISITRHPKRQRLWRVPEAKQKLLELSATKPLPEGTLSSR